QETYDGVQMMKGHQFPDGIDPYKIPGDPSSGLLWGISNETLSPAGSGDKKIQAYNFRVCLTNNPQNLIPITRPVNYDSSRYGLLLRLIEKTGKISLNDYFIWSIMPNQKTDINNKNGFSTDMIGMNWDYPEASYREREKIIAAHVDYTQGLLYFIGHDQQVPEVLRNQMLQWGYPKDEYTKTGHFTPQLYIREARRMIGEYVMTEHNCKGSEVVKDAIGMAAYTMDSHNAQRVVVNGMVKNEGNVEIGGFPPYPVSYRSITPRRKECTNLLVPVCLSASHIAYGSIRMEPVFMVLAQSSAIAAAEAIDAKKAVQEVDVQKIQKKLINDPLLDGSHVTGNK
ncbi:MAG: FAD-dependent oxidoreductase, partial [Bacteroidota bacterium]|nr:FAD-dependent oxidoreductase [Bacteroidota bacterium]